MPQFGMPNPNQIRAVDLQKLIDMQQQQSGQGLTGPDGFRVGGEDFWKNLPNQRGQQGGILGDIGGLQGMAGIAQGIGSLGQAYAAIKGVGMAKKQFQFQKDAYNTNLKNQTQTYNTALEDRTRNRNAFSGTPEKVDGYLKKHSL